MDKLCLEPAPHFPHKFNDLVIDPVRGWVDQEYECPGVVARHCTMEIPHGAHPYDEAGQRYDCEGTLGDIPSNDPGVPVVRMCAAGHPHDTRQFVGGNGDNPVSCGGWAD